MKHIFKITCWLSVYADILSVDMHAYLISVGKHKPKPWFYFDCVSIKYKITHWNFCILFGYKIGNSWYSFHIPWIETSTLSRLPSSSQTLLLKEVIHLNRRYCSPLETVAEAFDPEEERKIWNETSKLFIWMQHWNLMKKPCTNVM